jgi:hypothetical protein
LLPSAVLLGLVCTLNCLCIYAWEHPTARVDAHWTTRWATHHLRELGALILAFALLAIFFTPQHLPATACALSTALLLLLNANQRRFNAVHLRAAADFVLLTPILFWFVR